MWLNNLTCYLLHYIKELFLLFYSLLSTSVETGGKHTTTFRFTQTFIKRFSSFSSCYPICFFQLSFSTFFNVSFKAGANVLFFFTYTTKKYNKKNNYPLNYSNAITFNLKKKLRKLVYSIRTLKFKGFTPFQ